MLITDSVAIKVINSREILIGVGNQLKYLKKVDSETIVRRLNTGFRSKILGIEIVRKSTGIITLVHGGRYLAAFEISQGSVRKLAGCQFTDLISSVHCEDLENICLITGHNIALLVALRESFEVIKTSKCDDNSTLYCSHVEGRHWEDFLVYSGTALGDVIVWKPSVAGIINRIPAHKGVIFSITTDEDLLITTSDDRSAKVWKKGQNHVLSSDVSCFGHKSRVFRSRIVKKNGQKFILTVGEDSNLCVWHESGKFLFRKALSSGAVIWNLDYDVLSDTVFTTGSDGNVKSVELKEILEKGESPRKPFIEEEISKILFIDSQTLLVMTSEMYVLKLESGEWKSGEKIAIPDVYVSLIESVGGKIIICSHHEARIYKIHGSDIHLEHKTSNLLQGLIRTFYLTAPGEFLFVDDRGNCALTDESLNIHTQFSISLRKDLWCTKWITMARRVAGFLILSDRSGCLQLCSISPGQIDVKSIKKSVHGNLGVTEILIEEISEDDAEFWTSGRDGVLRKFLLDRNQKTLKEIFTEKVPISWIVKMMWLKNSRKLILGFNDENLVAWEKSQGVIFQLSTGGGHKYWDFVLNSDQSEAKVLSVWDKKPFLDKFSLVQKSENFLNDPTNWHTKSCNTVARLDHSGKSLLISGGDDNVLRINHLGEDELTAVGEVVTHISNIRAIRVIKSPETEQDAHLIFSVGGRAQICVTKIFSKDKKLQVQEFINYMLKANDFRRNKQSQIIDFCPETRFMCLTIDELNIYVGCSDGFIRKFVLDDDKILLKCSISHEKCILNIEIFELETSKLLLTMATDGKILVWDSSSLSEDSVPLQCIIHHDSGINCFDIWQEDGNCIILTGGDDQKITKTAFKIEKDELNQTETISTAALHSAAVTGIKIANRYEFYSTSVDQRIVRGNLEDLTMISEKFTSVSDLKGLLLDVKNKLIVFGAGMECNIEF